MSLKCGNVNVLHPTKNLSHILIAELCIISDWAFINLTHAKKMTMLCIIKYAADTKIECHSKHNLILLWLNDLQFSVCTEYERNVVQ